MSIDRVLPYHDADLSQLPKPSVVEPLDYETLFAERKTEFQALQPLIFENGQPVYRAAELVQTDTETYWKVPVNADAGLYYLDLESDPSTRHIQADVYRELLLRQRINEAALATMPAYATGADLDHIGLRYYRLLRLTVIPATATTPAVMESDAAYRNRMMLSIEGLAKGGSTGWYIFHALSASGLVKDITAVSPAPYHMTLTVLSHDGDGTASPELLETVRHAVTGYYAFPQGDLVTVRSAEIVRYALNATVQLYRGASSTPVMTAITAALKKYREQSERIGHIVDEDGLLAALRQPTVYRALIQSPVLPLTLAAHQAAYCETVNVTEVYA
jgi:phage-related baseplate assembly protein